MEKMKFFTAECFRYPDGTYLSLSEYEKSRVKIQAIDENNAFEQLAERQGVDSELYIQDRWNVYEVK